MANSYTQATLDPECVHLTNDQLLWLEASCADTDPTTLDDRKGFYVLWRECFDSEPELDRFRDVVAGEYEEVEDDGEAETLIAQHAQRLHNISFEKLLQNILRNPENSHIEKIRVEGAFTCSRMCPNSFGGFAMVVTRKHYAWYNTGSLDIEGGQLKYPPEVHTFDD